MSDNINTKRIILTRHGQTEWNKEFRFQGKTDVNLTDEGKRQAEKLALRLTSWPPDVIYTSPLSRAHFTASKVAEKFNLKPIIIPELVEINFGEWEGLSINELKMNQCEKFSRWRNDPFFNPPEGSENWEELSSRLSKAVQKFLSGDFNRILVVSHGGIMRALYAVFLGFNPHKTWNFDVSNCSLSGVEIRNNIPCLSFANDDFHIKSEFGVNLPLWSEK